MSLLSFSRAIDRHGYLSVPPELRPLIGPMPVLTKAFPHCLDLFPASTWSHVEPRVRQLMRGSDADRRWALTFIANSIELVPDRRARIFTPQHLKQSIGIGEGERAAVLGLADRVRIFAWDRWRGLVRDPQGEDASQILRIVEAARPRDALPAMAEVVERLMRFATDSRVPDDPRRLELDVGDALELADIGVVEVTQPSGDGGADVLVYVPSTEGHKILVVQCKSGRAPATVSELRELIGVIGRDGAHLGLLVAVAGFTSASRDEARMSRIPICLADSASVASWLSSGTVSRMLGLARQEPDTESTTDYSQVIFA